MYNNIIMLYYIIIVLFIMYTTKIPYHIDNYWNSVIILYHLFDFISLDWDYRESSPCYK